MVTNGAATAANPAPVTGRSFDWDAARVEEYRRNLNERPYVFPHRLALSALFDLGPLLELAARKQRETRDDVVFDIGDARVEHKPTHLGKGSATLDEVAAGMATANAWINIKKAEKDPLYAEMLNTLVKELAGMATSLGRRYLARPKMDIIVTSPRRVTPYHIDPETNFLLQMRGSKQVSVFDQKDRSLLSEEEIEGCFVGNRDSASFREGSQEKAYLARLEPGLGVHLPLLAPHWVRNSDDVSVSVSVNFPLPPELGADLYRFNYRLRRLGLSPRAPGASRIGDGGKTVVYRALKMLTGRG